MTTEIMIVQFLCALALASISAYIGGRVHQRRREDDQRRAAFRAGFVQASAALATMASPGRRTYRRIGTAPPPGRPADRAGNRAQPFRSRP
jgi:hypothetical protein